MTTNVLPINLLLADMSTTPFFVMLPGLSSLATHLREKGETADCVDFNVLSRKGTGRDLAGMRITGNPPVIAAHIDFDGNCPKGNSHRTVAITAQGHPGPTASAAMGIQDGRHGRSREESGSRRTVARHGARHRRGRE